MFVLLLQNWKLNFSSPWTYVSGLKIYRSYGTECTFHTVSSARHKILVILQSDSEYHFSHGILNGTELKGFFMFGFEALIYFLSQRDFRLVGPELISGIR